MKQKTDKKPSSLDIKADKLRCLKEVVPEAFDEDGRLNIPALERVLGDNASAEKTRFGLQWHGRADCIEVAKERSIATLKPARKESVNFDKTENLFIEGDNLEALKLLQRSYYGKVKMIYIDPPYNTGQEFIYPDKYAETLATYLAYTGQTDENGHKFSTNTERVGRFHSNWLNMMFPRLYLARNLLRNDGVIFISIDDHEQAALKLLCDEIFGEYNFRGSFVWEKKKKPSFLSSNMGSVTEHVLAYVKNKEQSPAFIAGKVEEGKKYPFNNAGNSSTVISFPPGSVSFGMKDGTVKAQDMSKDNIFTRLLDDVLIKGGKNKNSFRLEGEWRYSQSTIDEFVANAEEIRISQIPFRPNYISNGDKDKKSANLLSFRINAFPTYEDATKELRQIFGIDIMKYPKPIGLIKFLVKSVTGDDDLVLDFFAGSCPTAHAVMQLNAEESSKRKFICVQLPEPTKEESKVRLAGYANIADIGKERIRRAAKQIAKEQNGKLNLPAANGLDLGFKVLKLAPSNFHVWEEDASKVKNLKKQIKLHTQPLIDEKTKDDDILYEILLWQGLSIAAMPEKKAMEGKTVYAVEGGDTLICLDRKLTRQVIDAMAKTDARRVVCLDAGFQKNDQLKTNAMLAFKTKSERKQSEVVFITI